MHQTQDFLLGIALRGSPDPQGKHIPKAVHAGLMQLGVDLNSRNRYSGGLLVRSNNPELTMSLVAQGAKAPLVASVRKTAEAIDKTIRVRDSLAPLSAAWAAQDARVTKLKCQLVVHQLGSSLKDLLGTLRGSSSNELVKSKAFQALGQHLYLRAKNDD